MLEDLKKELKLRKDESEKLKAAIEQEKLRLQQERDAAKKSLLRKIKAIDTMKRKQEDKQDAKALSAFAAQKENEVSLDRKQRNRAFAKTHSRTLLLMVAGVVALFLIIIGIVHIANHANAVKNYEEAVALIIDKDFAAAENILKNTSYSDSYNLLCYAQLEKNINEKSRTIQSINADLMLIDTISNSQIQSLFEQTASEVRFANEVQQTINSIDLKTLPSDLKEKVQTIDSSISSVGARYLPLLKTDTYELAKKVLYHIENNTDAGIVILALNQLPQTISLSDESAVKEIRQKYDSLSDSDKLEVCNIQVLLSAESSIQTLAEEKKAADEKAAAEKAAKEAAEREAAERAAKEQAAKEAAEKANRPKETDGITVYITPTGKCYHRDPDCGGKNSRPTTLTKAQNSGYRACQKCA